MAGWAAGASLPTVANERSSFYRRVLEQLLDQGVIRKDMSVLVVAGGAADRDAFHDLGFERVTISNVDEDVAAEELAPYEWSFQDAEALTYPDGSFDLAVVSAGLHHCRSPHRALLELYRVASVAALAIESRDSALMRVAVRLGAVDEYELAEEADPVAGMGREGGDRLLDLALRPAVDVVGGARVRDTAGAEAVGGDRRELVLVDRTEPDRDAHERAVPALDRKRCHARDAVELQQGAVR